MTTAQRHQSSVGIFDGASDVGGPAIGGSTRFDAATGTYTLTAAGVNMWSHRDEFQFAWVRLRGDFALEAHVTFVGRGVEPHRKAGCIVRPTFDDDAPYVDAALHGDGLTALQYRLARGGLSEHVVSSVRGADTIRFERRGRHYRFFASRAGEPAVPCELAGPDLGDEVYAGLFLCSHNAAVVEQAIFDHVRIEPLPTR
jgi:hypothetical protein